MLSGLSSFNLSPSFVSIRVGKRMLWSVAYQGGMLSFRSLKPRFLDFIPSKLYTIRMKTSRKWGRILQTLALSLYKMVFSSKKTSFASPKVL